MNRRLMELNHVSESEMLPSDRVGEAESAIVELAQMVSDNEVNIEDLTNAVIELAELIGG
mgnify:CR=1 FL=1